MDHKEIGAGLMKDPKFMEMFQKVLGEGKIPDEKDPNRDAWLKGMQEKLAAEAHKEAKAQLEQPVSDKDGQWMYVVPDPGFCIKCSTTRGTKVFINVCRHERIAEPIPLEPEEQEEDDAVKFKIPLSCGQSRPEKDKSGKPCKVYDVIVNPNTIQRCADDNEFRRFVAALCMTWIKQKSEPELNADEFKNVNFKCKGVPEAQRIRLSVAPKASNAMGDEIQLPGAKAATAPSQAGGSSGGTKPMVQEMPPAAATTAEDSSSQKATYAIAEEGTYDWSTHARAARHPNFRDAVPKAYRLTVTIPGVTTIKEVAVQVVRGRQLELSYVDDEETPFLVVPLPFHVSEDPSSAKFIKSKSELRLVLDVALPDETDITTKTKASRDATEEEEEERLKAEAAQEARLQEQRARYERMSNNEKEVMTRRKEYVDNVAAMQEGVIPPVIREEFETMNPEQQRAMLVRLEGKIRKGDSVDELLDKLPDDVLASVCRFLREKLGLEARPAPAAPVAEPSKDKKVRFADPVPAAPVEKPKTEHPDGAASTWEAQLDKAGVGNVEYNFAKKAEKLFGVLMNNRYLFALDH